MKYVYIESEPGLYTVGFYTPSGEWEPESDHDTADEAATRAAVLNGEEADERQAYTSRKLHEWAEWERRETEQLRAELAAADNERLNLLARIEQLEAEMAAMRAAFADSFMPTR